MAQTTDNFLDMIDSHLQGQSQKEWSGTLRDYIKLVIANPTLHMGAHARVLKMIESHGVEKDEKGETISYKFFENDLFGVQEPIEEIMAYLRAAAAGSEVGRRILLLYGPTSSGKSQMAILLKEVWKNSPRQKKVPFML